MEYKYKELSVPPGDLSGTFSLRLLHLLPSPDRAAQMYCRLIETQIADIRHGETTFPSAPNTPYQALSYTWGSSVFPKTLHVVHGQDSNTTPTGIIAITENLHSALQTLRKTDETLVLWVDAICINQADIPERNSQVSYMPQTYAGAASVLVWLGNESLQNDGSLCIEFFTELAALIASGNDQDQEQADKTSWRRRFIINQLVSAFLEAKGRDAISSFLTRPWFRRRWVAQEVVLAKDVAIVCGTSKIPWPKFQLALKELFENDKGGFDNDHRTTLRIMSRIRDTDSGPKTQVPLDTLIEFADFECENPKDRLYALYGVIQRWFMGLSLGTSTTGSINYARSTEDVYTDFAILMMRLTDSTALRNRTYNPLTHVLQLAAAIRRQADSATAQDSNQLIKNIPSWVPDWTGSLRYKPLNHSPIDLDASTGIPTRRMEILPVVNHTRLLVATGLICDTITASVSLDTKRLFGAVYEAKDALNAFLCSVAKAFDETKFPCGDCGNIYIPTGQHIVSALATTIVANWEHTPKNSFFGQHPRFIIDFLEQLASAKYQLPEIMHKWPAYIELVAITMSGRKLILTRSGYMGIGAADVRTGDLVCLLSNTRIPFILRPSSWKAKSKIQEDSTDSSLPGCHKFQSEDQFKSVLSKIKQDPSDHCTFQLMGDAYVHGQSNGEACSKLGARLVDSLMILPIA
jgi:hypothetical protein